MAMETENTRSAAFRRERKMRLWLPVGVVPLLVLGFYALGGGKGANGQGANVQQGLNMTLPLAQFDKKGKPADKLGAYQQADADSARYKERLKKDPYGARVFDSATSRFSGMPQGLGHGDGQAENVLKRVAALKEMLQKQQSGRPAAMQMDEPESIATRSDLATMREVTHRLQTGRNVSADPEMDRIERVIDKLNRVAHPGEFADTVDKPSNPPPLPVARPGMEKDVNNWERANEASSAFIEIGETPEVDTGRELALAAVIEGEQTVTAGMTVAMRLSEEAEVGGSRLPRNQLLYGKASLSGERLLVNISSFRVGESILPVALEVYDLDGLAGIRAPGAITREVSKESAQESLTGLQLASVDQTFGGQAAGAGLQFAKSLAGRKLKLVRVNLPAGYRVLLKNVKLINEKR